MEDPSLYFGLITSILFSAFFSGIEIAFISADMLHIEVMSKKGTFPAKVLSVFAANRSHFLATLLVGNNLSIVPHYTIDTVNNNRFDYCGIFA
jgi:putative hemolysin